MQRQHTRNEQKRKRIGKRTLVVGMDIGSQFHAMALMNRAGKVLQVCPKIYSSRQGFEYFLKVIKANNGLRMIV